MPRRAPTSGSWLQRFTAPRYSATVQMQTPPAAARPWRMLFPVAPAATARSKRRLWLVLGYATAAAAAAAVSARLWIALSPPPAAAALRYRAPAVADAVTAAACRSLAATDTPSSYVVVVAQRVVARWRALVAAQKGVVLLRLLEELPDLFVVEVIKRLDPTDRTMLAQVGRPWLAAVLASGLPRLPKEVRMRLQLKELCMSVERLAWAKANGCRWGDVPNLHDGLNNPCAMTASGGHLDVLQWARQYGCQWNRLTCAYAAERGHLDVLSWAREHDCPWDATTCAFAAINGHLDVLRWARENNCPCDMRTCGYAAGGGHLEVLKWAREQHCPWDDMTCSLAALGGHLEALRWARENGCPWGTWTCLNAAKRGHLDVLRWAREHDCPWSKRDCEHHARGQPETLRWVQQQPDDE